MHLHSINILHLFSEQNVKNAQNTNSIIQYVIIYLNLLNFIYDYT